MPYWISALLSAMERLSILAACNLLWFVPSTILFFLIHKYIEKKAPAWQSILDLLLLDLLKVMIVYNIVFFSMIYTGLLYGQLNPIMAQVYLATSASTATLSVIMQEIILILKIVIIFKPGMLTDQPDQKVIGLFRRSSFMCSCIRFIFDFYLQRNRPCCSLTLEYLTGTKMISRVSPGPMCYSILAILALTYLFVKIKAPKLPEHHKGQDFLKGIVAVALSWIVAILVYGSFTTNGYHTKLEELLIGHIIVNTCWNFLVPLYYVYNTPKLCQYVRNSFIKPKRPNRVNPIAFHVASTAVVIHMNDYHL